MAMMAKRARAVAHSREPAGGAARRRLSFAECRAFRGARAVSPPAGPGETPGAPPCHAHKSRRVRAKWWQNEEEQAQEC